MNAKNEFTPTLSYKDLIGILKKVSISKLLIDFSFLFVLVTISSIVNPQTLIRSALELLIPILFILSIIKFLVHHRKIKGLNKDLSKEELKDKNRIQGLVDSAPEGSRYLVFAKTGTFRDTLPFSKGKPIQWTDGVKVLSALSHSSIDDNEILLNSLSDWISRVDDDKIIVSVDQVLISRIID